MLLLVRLIVPLETQHVLPEALELTWIVPLGADAAFHMAEEVHNPSIVIPRSIMATMLLNGTCGFAMVIAILFCIGDVEKAMSSPTGYPFMEIFLNATHSVAGAAVMSSIITILGACATVGLFASTSRLTWSFARDRAFPFWRTLSKVPSPHVWCVFMKRRRLKTGIQVDSRSSVPLWSIVLTTTISFLLAFIVIGSPTAFNDIVSLSVSGLYSSYLMAAVLLLYRRCTSGFKMPDSSENLPALANTTGAELVWGPWRIPGIWGILNNSFAICYLLVVWFFSFWPPMYSPTAATMNYSSLVTGSVFIFSIIYYFIHGHKEYNGPIVEI